MDETSKKRSSQDNSTCTASPTTASSPRRERQGDREVVRKAVGGAQALRLGASAHPDRSLRVHLLAGLPTEAVRSTFEWVREVMPVFPLDALAAVVVGDATRIGVLLPPFVEPSLVVESWVECDFLPYRFGRPAHVAGVSTFVDVDHVVDHLASAAPLSRHGWGRSAFDRRTVADIVAEQIESATHLVLVGSAPLADSLARCLTVLNPGASRLPFRDGSLLDLTGLAAALGADDPDSRGRGGEPTQGLCQDHSESDAPPAARSVPVVPPWLPVLQGEGDPAPTSGLFVYRRARPFDPTRLGNWLADPPRDLVRGKGHIWLAGEPDQSFGYSCAGSVHRLFPAGRWWASSTEGAWPSCSAARLRLLERWHPRFGDRRQELVFAGVDLDPDRLCAGLDACLLAEEAIDDSLHASREECLDPLSTPSRRLH